MSLISFIQTAQDLTEDQSYSSSRGWDDRLLDAPDPGLIWSSMSTDVGNHKKVNVVVYVPRTHVGQRAEERGQNFKDVMYVVKKAVEAFCKGFYSSNRQRGGKFLVYSKGRKNGIVINWWPGSRYKTDNGLPTAQLATVLGPSMDKSRDLEVIYVEAASAIAGITIIDTDVDFEL